MAKTRQRKVMTDTLAKVKCLQNVDSHKLIKDTSGNRSIVVRKKNSLKNKTFNDKEIHSKKKYSDTTSFSCDKCKFKSKKYETLLRHFLTHIEESFPILTSYSCIICAKKFRKLSRLELHKIKMHRINDLSTGTESTTFYKTPIHPMEDCEALLESHIIPQNYISPDIRHEIFQNSLNSLNSDNESTPQLQKPSEDCEKLIEANKIPCITPDDDYKFFHNIDNSLKDDTSDNGCELDTSGNKCFIESHKITGKAKLVQQNKDEDCEKVSPLRILQNTTKKRNIIKSSNSLTNNILENTKGKAKNVSVKHKISDSIEAPIKSMRRYKKNMTETKKKSEIKHKTIKKHEKQVDQEFACQFCTYKTKIKNVLKAHILKHSKEQPFSCNQCEFKSGWRNALKKHAMIHTDEKPYACDKCEYRAFQSSNLRRHMKVHSGTKRKSLALLKSNGHDSESQNVETHKCEKCQFKTGYPEILVMHLKTHVQQLLICDICNYKTSSKFRLINHFRRHTKELACGECKFKCKNLETFNSHTEIHKPQTYILTSYICNICNKKFRKHGLFELHKNKHISKLNSNVGHTHSQTEEIKFKCELCNYKCKRKHDLAKHKRSHTGEKPYECEFCTYKSSTTSHLVVHTRKHTGEKPYICKVCGYRCKQIGLLQKHMKMHG